MSDVYRYRFLQGMGCSDHYRASGAKNGDDAVYVLTQHLCTQDKTERTERQMQWDRKPKLFYKSHLQQHVNVFEPEVIELTIVRVNDPTLKLFGKGEMMKPSSSKMIFII